MKVHDVLVVFDNEYREKYERFKEYEKIIRQVQREYITKPPFFLSSIFIFVNILVAVVTKGNLVLSLFVSIVFSLVSIVLSLLVLELVVRSILWKEKRKLRL